MNLDEVAFGDVEENCLYTSSRATISDPIGARKLGGADVAHRIIAVAGC